MNQAEVAYEKLTQSFTYIDLDTLDRNIAFVNQAARNKGVRMATKSVRSIELHVRRGSTYIAAYKTYRGG